jgi:hypothetical protein
MIQTEKDFEDMWNKMKPKEREGYAVHQLLDAFYNGRITNKEAAAAIETIAEFADKFNASIPYSMVKMINVISEGGVRFTIENNRFITQNIDSAEVYVKFVSALPISEQIRIKNNAINLLRRLNLLTTDEANEALSDVMKMSVFKDYDPSSEGSMKLNRVLEMVFDFGCDANDGQEDTG